MRGRDPRHVEGRRKEPAQAPEVKDEDLREE